MFSASRILYREWIISHLTEWIASNIKKSVQCSHLLLRQLQQKGGKEVIWENFPQIKSTVRQEEKHLSCKVRRAGLSHSEAETKTCPFPHPPELEHFFWGVNLPPYYLLNAPFQLWRMFPREFPPKPFPFLHEIRWQSLCRDCGRLAHLFINFFKTVIFLFQADLITTTDHNPTNILVLASGNSRVTFFIKLQFGKLHFFSPSWGAQRLYNELCEVCLVRRFGG